MGNVVFMNVRILDGTGVQPYAGEVLIQGNRIARVVHGTRAKEVRIRGKRVAAHARSCESIKQCVRHGIDVIYHASFTDDEALDMLEATRDRHFKSSRSRWAQSVA